MERGEENRVGQEIWKKRQTQVEYKTLLSQQLNWQTAGYIHSKNKKKICLNTSQINFIRQLLEPNLWKHCSQNEKLCGLSYKISCSWFSVLVSVRWGFYSMHSVNGQQVQPGHDHHHRSHLHMMPFVPKVKSESLNRRFFYSCMEIHTCTRRTPHLNPQPSMWRTTEWTYNP